MSRIISAALFLFFPAIHSMQPQPELSIRDFEKMISKEQIAHRVRLLGYQINTQYATAVPRPLIIVSVMKGALMLTADLMRALAIPSELEYIQASSYGHNGTQAGTLTLVGLEKLNIQGKHVLLVDDIFDTGVTISQIKAELLKKNPASLKSLVLLHKIGKSKVPDTPDYVGFPINDRFVIGYGLDYKEQFRGLPDIWAKKV